MNATVIENPKQFRAEAMTKIMVYAYNYRSNFIQEAFKDDPRLADHFQAKFNARWTPEKATEAFVTLFLDMSGDNRIKLAKWIDENFKG